MKLLMESWRKYLSEEELNDPAQTNSKIIFMAGAPGSGKSTVLKGLGLLIDIVNADTFYEKYLKYIFRKKYLKFFFLNILYVYLHFLLLEYNDNMFLIIKKLKSCYTCDDRWN